MNIVLRRKSIIFLSATTVLCGSAFWFFSQAGFFSAEAEISKWKSFKEDNYDFSMGYPANWQLDVNYGQYDKGLMDASLNNKKCSFDPGVCDTDCVDMRIFVGKKPSGGEISPLFTQLYEDFMMVRDFSSASLVSALKLSSKKVFKVANDSPTQAVTGACGGPLYVFETDSGYFVYIFAGLGENSLKENIGIVEKIISSINI